MHFRSYPANMPVFFGAIDAFVVNKSIRPYDTAIIKALASGVPVVARSSETNNYLLQEGQIGLLYKTNDLENFAAKMILILTQNKVVEHLRACGKAAALEKYDKDTICNLLEESLYTSMKVNARKKGIEQPDY